MNWTKSIVFIALSSFLFAGSIGMGIFSKYCPEEGTNVSYFVPGENECCKKSVQAQSKKPDCGDCCSKEQKSEPKGDCCDTSFEHVKVDLDFFHKVELIAVLVPLQDIEPIWESAKQIQGREIQFSSDSDPPPLLRQERLASTQQWLI